jgi:tetratricopeptide (TPR) repeat protein
VLLEKKFMHLKRQARAACAMLLVSCGIALMPCKAVTQEIRKISTVTQGFQAKYNTIAHEILNIEAAASNVTPEMYVFIDGVIDLAKTRIPARQTYTAIEARAALFEIDRILTEKNVVYPASDTAMGFVDQLSDGLRPRIMNAREIEVLAADQHNGRRAASIRSRRDEPFYVNDCDTASFLYLAVAEVLGIPLFLVELPFHNFVRFEDRATRIDWETMYATEIRPGSYEQAWRIPPELVSNRVYLSSMSRLDVIGYVSTFTAEIWSRKKQDLRAFDDDDKAIALYPRGPRVWNQGAWHLATASNPALRNGTKAVELAKRAIAISKTPNILDTLACAYAAASDFAKAIDTEKEAQELYRTPQRFPAEKEVPAFADQIRRFEQGRACVDDPPPDPASVFSSRPDMKNLFAHTSALAPRQ